MSTLVTPSFPIITFDYDVSLESLFNYQPYSVEQDWQNQPFDGGFSFLVATSPKEIYFTIQTLGFTNFNKNLEPSDFVSGLWEMDVAELFIKEDFSDRYFELNLSPSGAWWGCVFDSYREQNALTNSLSVQIISQQSNNVWNAAIALKRSDLDLSFSFTPTTKLNVTAILGQPHRHHLSWANLPLKQVDFHQTKLFYPASSHHASSHPIATVPFRHDRA